MAYAIAIAPVVEISIRPYSLKYHCFFGLAKGQYKEYLIAWWYIESLAEFIPLHSSMNTPTQTFLPGTQKNALSGYSMVAEKILTDFRVTKYNNICGGRSPSGGPGQSLR